MTAENEIVKLALECIRTLAAILKTYDLPPEVAQIIEFTDRNFARLEESKAIKHKVIAKVTFSKDAFEKLLTIALWDVLTIGRIYNGLYLKGHKRKDFIKEATALDKGVQSIVREEEHGT
jgi:hypothetical protein